MTYQTAESFKNISNGVDYDDDKNYTIIIDLFGGSEPYKKSKKGIKVIMI